ncbi:MAG TPA: FtsX-like permease family protein, partial [Candidatus Angelobacter sp.]|nr:FtsX-like permease family protein [Candidatus Angelobacter sp.]
TGLMLVRVIRRSGELATRLALGATRTSLLRQLMMEPLILTLAGGAAGVALSNAGLKLFQRLLPPDIVPIGGLSIDYRVLFFAFLASLATAFFIGILPAFEVRRAEIRPALASGNARSGSTVRTRTRQALIAGEVMLTVVLLAGAGLLIRTLVHLQTLPPGFDASNVMSAQVSLDDSRYHDTSRFHKLLQQSLNSMRNIPGVESAAMGLSLPFERGLNDSFYLADGPEAGKNYISSVVYVTPEYFRVLRIPLLSGRGFSEDDTATSERVIIVNAAFARRFFHSTDVVGRHIRLGKTNASVIGVVGDVTKEPGLVVSAPLDTEVTYYFPASQVSQQLLNLVHVWFQPSWIVRTTGSVAGITEAMQKAMAEADPSLPIASFHPLGDLQALALRQQRFEALLLGVLASLALLLSLIGVYGLVSNMVVQRTREIGIRMALGASLTQAMIEIGNTGFRAVGIGLAAGLALAMVSVRIMKSELYGVKTYDPVTFAAVLALLIFAASVATLAPTLRIARIDPAATLRAE